MRWVRRIALGVGGLLLLLIAAAIAGAVWIDTPSGKAWLAATVNDLAAGRVHVGAIGGRLPFHPVIAHLELLDPDGVWASADDLELDIAAGDLWRRRLTVKDLSASVIDMCRSPASATAPASEQNKRSSFQLPVLPLDVDIQRLAVASARLPSAIFGEPTLWTLTANARLVGRAAWLNLSAAEQGGAATRADLRFALSPERVGVTATVDDPHGLLVRPALGEALPLSLQVVDDDSAGGGPADWHGRLTAALGDRARLEATLHLAEERDAIVFQTDGTFDGARLLPPHLQSILGNGLGFHVAARDLDGAGVAVDGLELRTDALRAEGSGVYRARGRLVDAALRLSLPDLAALSDAAGQKLAGTADVGVVAKGPLDALKADLQLQGRNLAMADTAVEEIAMHLRAAGLGDRGYQLDGDGRLAGIRSGGAALPGGLGETVGIKLAAHSDAAFNDLALTDFSVTGAGAEVAGSGTFHRRTQDIAAKLRLKLDALDRYAAVTQPGLKGRGQIDLAVDGNLAGRAVATVQGGFDDLVTGIPAADALIGRRLRIDARADRDERGHLRLDPVSLDLAKARLIASGEADSALSRLSGEFNAAVDDLSVLRQAGMPAAGRVELRGTVRGTPEAPLLDAELTGSGLVYATSRVDRATARVQASGGGAPSGTLTADLRSGDLAVAISGEAAVSRDGKTLSVNRLSLRSGASRIEARLRTALDTLLTSGDVTADVPDLRPFSTVAGQELGGRVNLKLALSAQRGQAADLTLTAADLRAGAGAASIAVQRVAASGALSDLLRRPSGKLDATVAGVEAAGAKVSEIRLTSQSSQPGRFGFDADVTGDYNGPFAFTAGGDVAQDRGTTRATVARFSGRVTDIPLRLTKPLVLTSRGAAVSLADLALAVGDGQVSGAVSRDERSLELTLDARRLPVGLGAHFAGRDDVAGTLDVSAEIAGPASRPRGRLALDVRDLRAGPARRGAPTLAVSASAELGAADVTLNGAVKAADAQVVSVAGTVPVSFGPRPGELAVAMSRPMNVRLTGDGDLARLADLLPLGGDRLAGRFVIALDATGTPQQPQVTGNVAVQGGRYESLATGLRVQDLALDLGAERNRIFIRTLSATDGDKGRLDGQGSVSLAAGEAPTFDVTTNLVAFQALRRSDASLTASGSATVTGAITAPIVVARITVDKAELFIPDPPPPAARKIPVTVIDSATGVVLQRADAAASSSGGVATLDVAVRVSGRTFVRGRGLDSEWQGDIKVHGSSAAPDVTGALTVLKGKFSFFGKDMTLTRGNVTFTGGKKIEPVIDVLAEASNAGTNFQVAVTGTPDDLKIKLSSDPSLPQDEILSRLIFGTDMTKLTPAQGLQLAQAAATLSSGGPGMLDKMRHKLGLDVLNVGSMDDNDPLRPTRRTDSTGGNGGMQNTGVSGGKYIANGVYVGAVQGLSGETRSKVEVEVLPHVNVESTAGTRSESLGLNWKLDY